MPRALPSSSFDYVIVGGGSAGCVLAHRLSADPHTRVCLLEAGPRDLSPFIHLPLGIIALMRSRRLNWAYWTEPQARLDGRRLFWPRGKTLGGSSAINAMIYTRGHPADFDHWAALGNAGWSYRELLPYFRRAEHCERGEDAFHGVGGPLNVASARCPNPLSLAFVEAALAAGHLDNPDFNAAEQEGVGLYQLMQKDGARCSNARAYLRPALNRHNLTVVTGAHATAVRFAGRRAIGVNYRRGGHAQRVEAAAEVLLCGGAINTPQLLLLSGVGPAAELARHGITPVQELAGVGENLQDHLDVALVHQASSRVGISLGPRYWWRGAKGLVHYLTARQGEFTSNIAEAGGFLRSHAEASRPDLQLHFLPAIEEQHGLDLRECIRSFGYTLRICDLHPLSRGSIRLRSADPLAPPRIDPNYLSHPEEIQRLVRGLRLGREILALPPLATHSRREIRPGAAVESERDLQAYVRAHAETIYHPVGTCKMGSDPLAVVDAKLRVHGLEGLRVVDASIMPTLVGGNTNAPTTAIAEKAAALILGQPPAPIA